MESEMNEPWRYQPTPVVVRQARRCPNGAHLLMTVITLGMWLPIWLVDLIVSAFSQPKIEYH